MMQNDASFRVIVFNDRTRCFYTIVHSTQLAMRPISASGVRGRNPPADLTRRPMTAVASESNHTNDRPTLIGRPTLINPAERARILQSQRAAALRRRNVQLRIAKIEAEPVAEWQSLSKPVAPHDEAPNKAESSATSRIIAVASTKPANSVRPRPRTSSPPPTSPIQSPTQSRSPPSSSEYSSSEEEQEKEKGIRGLIDDSRDDDGDCDSGTSTDDDASREDNMAVHALASSPAKIGRPVSSSQSDCNMPTSSPTEVGQFNIANLGLEDSAQRREFLTSPCPKEVGIIQCYIRRHKAGAKKSLFPEYRVYLKEGDTFLLTSKKRKNKKTANYLISMGRNDFDKASDNIVGKLRSNFLGTDFQIYDAGRNPNNSTAYFDERTDVPIRSELGAVVYSSNLIGSRGPRQMQVCINRIDDNTGKPTKAWQPAHRDEEMIQCFKHRIPAALRHLVVLENKEPQWNEDLGAHVLNFNGRVTQASVKNFQLIDKSSAHHHNEGRLDKRGTNGGDSTSKRSDGKDAVVLQFGRVAKDEFTLDFQWPMSPVQAFAIALSSCDAKLACD